MWRKVLLAVGATARRSIVIDARAGAAIAHVTPPTTKLAATRRVPL
jgi:hypothetical protein